jgi:hypothetical protein
VAHNLLRMSDMYHSNHLNSMQQPQGIEIVPRITDHKMILDTLPHPLRSPIRALQTFFGVTILVSSCTLPITTSLIFATELFDQGAAIRAKVDEQLTAAAEILGVIAVNLIGKTTKDSGAEQKQDTTGTTREEIACLVEVQRKRLSGNHAEIMVPDAFFLFQERLWKRSNCL